jgi:hypothetical protein
MVGQHRYPVLAAFPVVHHNLIVGKVDILHAQAHAFHESQPRPVQESAHDLGEPCQVPQYRRDLILGQHHGNAVRLFRAHYLVNPTNILPEPLLIEKQDGTQRLTLCGGSDTSGHG